MAANKRLNDLKYRFEMPCYFIANYFSDLRTKIDYSIEYLIALSLDHADKLNQIRNEFIQILDDHERLCLQQNPKRKIKHLLDELNKISDYDDDDERNNKDDNNILVAKIDAFDLKLNKILFLNKSFIFLKNLSFSYFELSITVSSRLDFLLYLIWDLNYVFLIKVLLFFLFILLNFLQKLFYSLKYFLIFIS